MSREKSGKAMETIGVRCDQGMRGRVTRLLRVIPGSALSSVLREAMDRGISSLEQEFAESIAKLDGSARAA